MAQTRSRWASSRRGEAEACGNLLLAANPLLELVVGFHPSRLTVSPVAVQQTGRLMATFCSDADTVGEFTAGRQTAILKGITLAGRPLRGAPVSLKPTLV